MTAILIVIFILVVIVGVKWVMENFSTIVFVGCLIAAPFVLYFTIKGIQGIVKYISKKAYIRYERKYFKSEAFMSIKESIRAYIEDCNELNRHIEDLKDTYIAQKSVDYGNSVMRDNSRYHYTRPEMDKTQYRKNIYNCSRTVCKNAQQQPFKYLCKYFDIKADEKSLSEFENLLNNFEAAEQGKVLLKQERERIIESISNDVPHKIMVNSYDRLSMELGFENVDFTELYFPRYIFQYVSPGGNSSLDCTIIMDIENLNKFVIYLADLINFRKSAAGQRALMTSALRQKIKERDDFTCQICGLSTYQEPNLLLEIDHIEAIANGGLTIESNLQTLCWRCNRKKGKS